MVASIILWARALQPALGSQRMIHNIKDIPVDSKISSETLNALADVVKRYGIDESGVIFVKMLNSLQGVFYIELTEWRKKDRNFIFGWFRHRIL
jgi:hypothetical protein